MLEPKQISGLVLLILGIKGGNILAIYASSPLTAGALQISSGNLFVGGFFGTNLVMDTIVTTAPAVNGDDAYIAKMFPPFDT